MDLGDDLRSGQVQQVRIALDVARVIAEAPAAILVLGQLAAVDEHAPGSVEDEDPLGEKLFELCSRVLHENDSRLRGREPEGSLAL